MVPLDKMRVSDTLTNKLEIATDTVIINIEEPMAIDTIEERVYIDTVKTEFEGFAEGKLEAEDDPFKKKKEFLT